MGYSKAPKVTPPGLGGWSYQGDVALGDPPAGAFYVDQTSMSSVSPTFELNVTDDKGISHLDWLQDLVNTNHLVLRNRVRPADALILELSSNTPGAGFQTLVGTITSGNGTFVVGATYDIWEVTTADDFVVGPASSTPNAVPTFPDTAGKVLQDNPTLLYTSGELQLTAATAAAEIQERAAAPTFAADKGHVWVRDDAPNTLVFTDDIGDDHPLGLSNNVSLGEWAFGSAVLGATAIGDFETNNATIASITAIRFNAAPNSGQSITTWADFLPQKGILYFQDTTDPGGTSVTFPYTSLTFPLGAALPQFNGVALSTNGTDHGTNWSVNDYSVQIVALPATLDDTINSSAADNDAIVPSTDPIIFRDNAVNFTPLQIISTNTVDTTPALEVQRNSSTRPCLIVSTTNTWIYFSATYMRPSGNTASNTTFFLEPADTTSASYNGVLVVVGGGYHSGSQRGGNLTLDAGASTSGTDGIIVIGDIASEIIVGHSSTPGVSITTGTDHPVAPVATEAQLWVKSDYLDPRGAGDATAQVRDGQVLMMTDDTGLDIELSWLAANYKTLLGGQLAVHSIEEQGIFAGGTSKVGGDSCVSYIYDHLANHWYQAFIDSTTADAMVTSSSDGGYTWEAFKTVDTAISHGDLAQPCTNGTNLGVAADGNFYLSTSLNSSDLPASATGNPGGASFSGSTGLVWSEQASLWVMCGDNAAGAGFIYTSPAAGTTWTNRTPAGMAAIQAVSMDIAHTGYGGYLGTERIMISCGTFSNDTFYSTNGGVSWTQDTTGNPTNGLECLMWAPSVGQAVSNTQPGVWVGIDAAANLYMTTAANGLDWFDTTTAANTIFRTMEWAGYGNTSTNQTLYQFTGGTDFVTSGGFGYSEMGVAFSGSRRLFPSNAANVRARYQWGNGVIMWDRHADSELVIGRYGPIKP